MFLLHRLLVAFFRRKVSYLILYEIAFITYCWFFRPWYIQELPTWFWAWASVSLLFLLAIEGRDVPFQFVTHLSASNYVVYGGLAFILSHAIAFVVVHIWPNYSFHVSLSPEDVFSIVIKNGHVAVTEESIKVAFTNFLAWPTRRNPNRRKLAVGVFGSLAVIIWAYLHVLVGHYGLEQFVVVLGGGFAIFGLICIGKNYFVTTGAHAFWNIWNELRGFVVFF